MKVVTILGARPQFIKAATVSREFRKSGIQEVIVHTGQHFDENMSDVFFKEMEIPEPDYHLEVHSLSHAAMTGRMLEKIEAVLLKENPDKVLVYGDTNSTLAGALAAAKMRFPLAHVEAGLRSFDMNMPEEINRIITDRLSQLLFCPTNVAVRNLENEGYRNSQCLIEQPGDVMYDAVLFYREKAKSVSTILQKENLTRNGFALATLHRAENTNDPIRLNGICSALNEINKTLPVVMPLHPRTAGFLESHRISLHAKVIAPVGYFDMLSLLENCKVVLTDSGGLQKEAYFFEKFCITLRDQTEWVELVEAGANQIVGADATKIISSFHKNVDNSFEPQSLFGSGDAARRIVKTLGADTAR